MQITQSGNQFIQPPAKINKDPFMNNLMKAKENLKSQMQKINEDKSIDEKTKQAKLKQLQTQMDELDQQMQRRQLDKLAEDNTKTITDSGNSSSDSNKTAEEQKHEAGIAIGKSIISAAVNKEQLTQLGLIRSRLISEDGEVSERVQRTERMMASRTEEINKSLAENRKATREYAQSSKEVEDNKQADNVSKNQENDSIIDEQTTTSGGKTQQSTDAKQFNDTESPTEDLVPHKKSNVANNTEISTSNAQRPRQTNEHKNHAKEIISREESPSINILL